MGLWGGRPEITYSLSFLLFTCPVLSWTATNQASLPHHLLEFVQVHVHCHPAISSSDALFSFCPWSFPASGTFPMSRLCASDGQNAGASASVLPVNIQGWSPLRLTGLISLLSKGFSGDFSSLKFEGINCLAFCLLYGTALTIVCDHWEDHSLDYTDLCRQGNVSALQSVITSR